MVASATTCGHKPHWVYVLRDPIDGNTVRYVGCTSRPVSRLKWHLRLGSDPRGYTPAYCWINSVLSAGKTPQMEIVSDALRIDAAYQFESDLIKLLGRSGHKLAQSNGVPFSFRHLVECDGKLFHNTVVLFHDGEDVYCRPENDFLHSRISGVRFRFAAKNLVKSLDGRFVLELL